MATASYEGGVGGKFPKRPFRRASGTPYDRPPAAVRSLRAHPMENGSNGWLSKLVDPASRIIARSASRLFSSVFRKRLTAPPETPEENLQSRQEVPEVVCIEQGGNTGDKPMIKSDTDGITELEQLLKQKTFTRDEFDRLTELLRSRTVEPSTSQPAVSHEKKEKANVSVQENGVGSSRLYGNISTPTVSLSIPEDEAASPAELAKAYMGSRPSKVSPSALSLRGQVFREETALPSNAPYTTKPSGVSIAPRSIVRFSGIPGLPENGCLTPRPRGRSAIYKMSRSPYFKAQSTTHGKGGGPTTDGYPSPSTASQWTPTNIILSGGKQVLKRRSSVIDSEFGSFGPIRRIRQKSNLVSPSKGISSSVHENLGKDVIQGSATSNQKPFLLDEVEYGTGCLQDAENGENRISYASGALTPPHSSEMARKISQQLEKLVPSPKEKSSELKAINRDGSPFKLTLNMLDGRALRSMEDIDSSKFYNVQGSGNFEAPSDTNLPSLRNSIPQKQGRVEENGSSKPAVSVVKLTSEANVTENAVISALDAKPGMRTAAFIIPSSAAVAPPKKPAFQMSAPEDSLELDDDSYDSRDSPSPSTAVKFESTIAEYKTFSSETAVTEKSLVSSSNSMPTSHSILNRERDMKVLDGPVVEKDIGFTFPVAPAPNTLSQSPPMTTVPTPLFDRSAPQKEQTPAFSIGSKDAPASILAPTTTGFTDSAVLKFGMESDSKLESSASKTTTTLLKGPNAENGGKTQKAGDLFKSFGNASSGLSTSATPARFAFGASTTSTLDNGSLNSTLSTFSVFAAPAVTPDSSGSSIISTSTATTTSSSSPFITSTAPIFSTVPSFQFGSGTSAGAPITVSAPLDKSVSTDLAPIPVKASPFGIISSTAPGTSSAFSSTGKSSSDLATSPPLPSTGTSQSGLATSAFSSTGNNIFGFSASAQSSSPSLSFANNSSQNSTSPFGTTAGSIFGTQLTQSGSGTQSAASQFGSFASSPTFGMSGSSSFSFGNSPFGSASSTAKPFSSNSGFGLSSSVPFSTAAGSSSSGSSSAFVPAAASTLFSSSSQPSTSSIFGSSFGSSTSAPSAGFSFGMSAPAVSSPLAFGSTSAAVFSFTSAGATTSSVSLSPAQSVFGIPSPAVGFSSGSPGNDQMNVEDSMADDIVQAAAPMVPTFGQPVGSPATSNLMFGSPAVASSTQPVFQFGSHQTPSPFQAAGNLELPTGGSFSLGSGGGDKSNRKIVKVRRDKLRKK